MFQIDCTLSPTLVVKVTAQSAKEAIQNIAFFSELPTECPRCKGPLHFTFRTPKDFPYYGLECPNGHAASFGQHQQGGTLFFASNDPKHWQTVSERMANAPQAQNNGGQQQWQAPPQQAPQGYPPQQYAGQQQQPAYPPPPQQNWQAPPQQQQQRAYPPAPAPGAQVPTGGPDGDVPF